ncbi:hypothetical protein DIPPA_35081 [Diplonema papillatum]|nr:hypothetical protein DIPPA_35081 [Diplonema papillatum]
MINQTIQGRAYSIRKQLHQLLTLSEDELQNYEYQRIGRPRARRLLNWLIAHAPKTGLPQKVTTIESHLKERLSEITLAKVEKNDGGPARLIITHGSDHIHRLHLNDLLQQPHIRQACPSQQTLDRTKITYRMNPPLFLRVQNVTEVSKLAPKVELKPADQCACRHYRADRNLDGHAIGFLADITKDKGLTEVVKRGRKYRCYQDHHSLEAGVTMP